MTWPSPARWRDLRALAGPALGYWGVLFASMGLFSGLVVLVDGPSGANGFLLVSLWAAAVVGVGFGQVCALTRLRLPLVFAAGALVSAGLFVATGATAATVGAVALFFGILWVLFPFFAVSGLLSLRTSSFQVFALFSPMVWITGSILLVAQRDGGAERWLQGQKWAIWDVATGPMLAGGVLLALVWLASRERHRLHRWSNAPQGLQDARVRRVTGDRLRASAGGCGTLLAAAGLALAVSIGTGLLAPYLWRSAPSDDPGDAPEARPRTDAPAEEPEVARGPPPPPRPESGGCGGGGVRPAGAGGGGGDGERASPSEAVEEAVRSTGVSLVFLVLMVVLALLGLAVFGPPVRRSVVLAVLRRPGDRTPSDAVRDAWRVAEIALRDLGVERLPGDSAAALARRARSRLPAGIDPGPLIEAAAMADRAAFGLGLDPLDESHARRHAEMVYQAVWDTLSERAKVAAIYRWEL